MNHFALQPPLLHRLVEERAGVRRLTFLTKFMESGMVRLQTRNGIIPFLIRFCTVAAVYDRRQLDLEIVQSYAGSGITHEAPGKAAKSSREKAQKVQNKRPERQDEEETVLS
jgi:hypothetical protein